MKTRTIIIGLILFSQLSCSNDSADNILPFKDDPSITTLNGTWKVMSFEDFSANRVEYKTEANSWGKDIVVTFNDNLNPGTLSGKVTTNSVWGEFDYVGVRQFKLSHYYSTFIMQPMWANKFNEALSGGDISFEVNQLRLRIYYDNKAKSVTLVRQ